MKEREFRGRALVVVAGLLVCQMGLACGYVFTVVMKQVVAEFEWSRAAYSAASAPVLLTMGLAAPVVGTLTERFGARLVLSCAAVVIGSALVAFSQITALWQFFAASALFGVGMTGVGDVAVGYVVAQWFQRQRGTALAIVYSGSNLGGILVPIAVNDLAHTFDWRTAIWVLGASATALILPTALFTVSRPARAAEELDAPATAVQPDRDLDLRAALRTRTFWALVFVLLSFYFYYLAINQHLVPFLTDIGFEDSRAAASLSWAVGLGVVSKLGIGLLADRIPARAASLLNFAVLTGASALLLFVDVGQQALLAVFLVAHGFAIAAENVVLPLVVVECFGAAHLASIYGALMITLFPGGVLGPIFAAAVFDELGDYRAAFATFAVLNTVALLALATVRRERPEGS